MCRVGMLSLEVRGELIVYEPCSRIGQVAGVGLSEGGLM
jgi:hypothetical protein